MSAVKIYLDVDGVLNALGPLWWGDGQEDLAALTGWPDFEQVSYGGYTLTVSRAMTARLNALDAEIVWATTWCDTPDHLDDLAAHLELIDRRKFVFPGRRNFLDPPLPPEQGWKVLAVLEDQRQAPSPFVWIDDDAIPEGIVDIFSEHGVLGPWLLLRPEIRTGLTSHQVKVIEAFVQQHGAVRAAERGEYATGE